MERSHMETKESLSSATSSPQSDDVPMDDAAAPSSGNSGDEGSASSPTHRQKEEEDQDNGVDQYKISKSSEDPDRTPSNLAKFKASQDLRIQTANLPTPSSAAESKPRAHSVGSAAATRLGGEDAVEDQGGSADGGADGGKTPVPVPSSTGKKRRRRTAAQIDRKFPCTYPGCTKAYGSEGSLTQHQRLKHRNQSPEPGVQAAQLNTFFLPLRGTPRSVPGAVGRASGAAGGARTVTIRPAGIDGLALHGFDVAAAAAAAAAATTVPENDALADTFLLASSPPPASTSHAALSHARHQLRARSNSMPVSFSPSANALGLPFTTTPLAAPPAAAAAAVTTPLVVSPVTTTPSTATTAPSMDAATPSGAKAKAPRRSRQASTPRSNAGAPATGGGRKPPLRRNKCRSKSESLQDCVMEPFAFRDELRPPAMDRSTSDTPALGGRFGFGPPPPSPPLPLPPPAASFPANAPPFDWRIAVAHSQHSESPVSSVEDAIDSDILSVLADYDTSDTGESATLELTHSGSFEDTTESSHASSSGGRFHEPDDEWWSQPETQYLTTHLEKMSMVHDSPPGNMAAASMLVAEDDPMLSSIKLEFADDLDAAMAPHARSEPVSSSLKHEFPGVSIDSFAVNAVDAPFVAGEEDMKDGLNLHVSGRTAPSTVLRGRDLMDAPTARGFKQEEPEAIGANAANVAHAQPSWTNDLAALEPYYSSSGIDQADYMDVDSSSYGPLHWKATDKLRAVAAPTLLSGPFDSLTSYLQHGDKPGAFSTLSDAFALDSVDYAMEEPRLSSPVVCQQKDL